MSFYRIPINKMIEQLWDEQFEVADRVCCLPPNCTSDNPCGEWRNLRSRGNCCRRAVELNGSLVYVAALAMAYNGTVDNALLHRIVDNKIDEARIEGGCLVIDMWDDDLGEMPLQHNPPKLMPC